MRDPHVVSLLYRVVPVDGVTFENPPAVESIQPSFRIRVADGIATVELLEHHATIESAQEAVELYLRAWELQTALQRAGRKELTFQYDDAEVIDRDPPPPGSAASLAGTTRGRTVVASISLSMTYPAYPSLPEYFVASPDVDVMWLRYDGYLQGREPIGSLAYFCLTVLEASVKPSKNLRTEVSRVYRVGSRVLDCLATLSTEVGDARTARKWTTASRPHAEAEIAWLEAAVRRLILRAGEYAFDPQGSFAKLTMNDFPKL